MKATCDIIQDLLPLYCDNACSEESKKVVEAHIQECKQCRDDLSQMKMEIKREIPQIDKQKIAEKAKNSDTRHFHCREQMWISDLLLYIHKPLHQ